ncbi:CheF family chemotaxis protein [Haloarcula sp. S1CR25-12]|uniref:Taxis protein CheF n=1 Tax=Haloarcula saliterrae TaxID=2950534 RepID=A0ABU2FBZ5_9EURY|nr:CheF family chemotaxis protein [Haloarcula sp. S1CR25-12]MDS0259793.1 CheF family chemotaxis protein [Haloarcula sp. S1CR25-12]
MSGDEHKVLDASGDFQYVVREGEPVADPKWQSCRLIVTNKRVVLATNDGKTPIPHSNISVPDEPDAAVPEDVPPGATVLSVGDTVLLVDASNVSDFAFEYRRATLQGEVILARHPAVVGGVIQDDAEWSKARFRLDDDEVRLQFPGGGSTVFDIDDVGTIETGESSVLGDQRTVVEVEHTDEEGRSVETHLSGMPHHTEALEALFGAVVEGREDDYELSEMESQVLMALYSGVSPFEMADFVGTTPDDVEEIYQTLLDVGAVDKVRTRTEVSLNAQGRNMASEAMSGE